MNRDGIVALVVLATAVICSLIMIWRDARSDQHDADEHGEEW